MYNSLTVHGATHEPPNHVRRARDARNVQRNQRRSPTSTSSSVSSTASSVSLPTREDTEYPVDDSLRTDFFASKGPHGRHVLALRRDCGALTPVLRSPKRAIGSWRLEPASRVRPSAAGRGSARARVRNVPAGTSCCLSLRVRGLGVCLSRARVCSEPSPANNILYVVRYVIIRRDEKASKRHGTTAKCTARVRRPAPNRAFSCVALASLLYAPR